MFKVGRTLILAAGFTAFAFIPAAMMLAPTARAQTMGEYGATVGSNASSAGTLGSSIGPENSVGSSIGSGAGEGGLNMGVGRGNLHSDVVNGQGPPRTIIIGGDDTSNYAHSPTREDDEDDASGDDWTEVKDVANMHRVRGVGLLDDTNQLVRDVDDLLRRLAAQMLHDRLAPERHPADFLLSGARPDL